MHIRFGSRVVNLPANRFARLVIGTALVVGGLFGFLPIVGFWMVPLGLLVLSVDIPAVRAWRRKVAVRLGRWAKARAPGLWRRLNNQ